MIETPCAVRLKSGLARREPLLVVNVDYASGSLVEFLGRNCADVLFVDCEQGDVGIGEIADLVRAAHIVDTPILVRLYSPDPEVIERYMYRGIDGIVVPRLDTPEQVRSVVEAVQYCFPDSHRAKSIVVQIETVAAARDLEAILAVPGVDALFVGPVDLAKSMGHRGRCTRPEVLAEVRRLLAAIAAAGRSAGMLVVRDTIDEVISWGANFLYLHADDLLREGVRPFADARAAAKRNRAG